MHPYNLRPVNMQNNAQPNMFMVPENLPHMPSSSYNAAMVPQPLMNHGFLPHPPLNMRPFHHVRGPNPFPRPNQLGLPPIGQNVGQVAPPPPLLSGPRLAGLISSLMTSTKQQVLQKPLEFDRETLRVRRESTITALLYTTTDLPRKCHTCGLRFKSQPEHSKHLDWHFNKNRTLKNRKSKKPSPKWFVNATMWLSSGRAESLGTETGFLPAAENDEELQLAVTANEDQVACALCGEPFDYFYSDETEEWMYRGAVYMNRSESLGPIVHAKCRSDDEGGSRTKRLRTS